MGTHDEFKAPGSERASIFKDMTKNQETARGEMQANRDKVLIKDAKVVRMYKNLGKVFLSMISPMRIAILFFQQLNQLQVII